MSFPEIEGLRKIHNYLITGAGNSGSLSKSGGAGGNFGEQTTLLHNEEESFALEPVDASAIRGQVNARLKTVQWGSEIWTLPVFKWL